MKKLTVIIAATAIALSSATSHAQTGNTAYSGVGYGLLTDKASGIQRSMGSVGVAMQNSRQINVMNPASYAAADSMTFLWDIGMDLSNTWSKEAKEKAYNLGGGLDYITAQFRIRPGIGMALGLLPYSNVGYTVSSEITNGVETRLGTGGLSELFLGAGWQPFRNFSIGANLSYLFGTTSNSTLVGGTTGLQSAYERTMQVRDFNQHYGLQYRMNMRNGDYWVLGATYSPQMSFHGHTWGQYYHLSTTTGTTTTVADLDTVGYTSMKGKYFRPHSYGVGLSYTHDSRLTAEADFTFQQWSKAKYQPITGFEPENMKFNDRWRASVGMSIQPNNRGNYAQRMHYRFGAFYNRDYMQVQGNSVRDFGLTMGFSFPALGTDKTLINLGFEWKHRNSSPVKLITENYFNITLSVNFNEMWFFTRKIQ